MAEQTVFVLNGPNLNLLGEREPEIYGRDTLADIEAAVRKRADANGFGIEFRQTNDEGALISWVQEAGKKAVGLVINPGGYTHTSVALLDAVTAIAIPVIELHLSNIHAREPFRARSMTARGASGVIMGFGAAGYEIAIDAMRRLTPAGSP